MAGERHAIDDPMGIDYGAMPVPSLKFLMQPSHHPSGIVEHLEPGLTACHTPWFTEVALEVVGVPEVAAVVLYVIPKDDDTSLLAACVGHVPDALHRTLAGADYGDALTALVARHWPETYTLLVNSQRRTPDTRILAWVRTTTKTQWVVADELRGSAREEVDHRQARSLTLTALETVMRSTSFPLDLPGALEVLGGPDRLSRRLKALSTLFTSAGSIGSGVADGLEPDDLFDLANDVKDFFGGLMDLRE